MADAENESDNILARRKVLYCGACGMPLEYCEYGPDFETHCNPWLKKYDADLFKKLRGATAVAASPAPAQAKPSKPEKPWTTEERLTAFYQKYVPEKVDAIPGLLEKYAGKEENLFRALVQKYGEEPKDPYFSDTDDEGGGDDDDEGGDDDDDVEEEGGGGDEGGGGVGAEVVPSAAERKKRRGASAKPGTDAAEIRVLVQKVAQKKKRNLTVIIGMETAGHKLKDVSKAFSKRFAGSSSVKKTADGKSEEIIIQGDHVYDVAEMICDKFGVPDSAVFIDMGDGVVVPLR